MQDASACTHPPPPRVVHRIKAAPTFPETASPGRRRQAGAWCSWSRRPPCSGGRRKQHQTSLGLSASQHPWQCCPCQHGTPLPLFLLGIAASAEKEGAAPASQPWGNSGWGRMEPIPPHFPAPGRCTSQREASPSCCPDSWCNKSHEGNPCVRLSLPQEKFIHAGWKRRPWHFPAPSSAHGDGLGRAACPGLPAPCWRGEGTGSSLTPRLCSLCFIRKASMQFCTRVSSCHL